jgi:hypothetical protein
MIAVDTYDELVYDMLEDKRRGQERLFAFIREARLRFASNDNERRTKRRAA